MHALVNMVLLTVFFLFSLSAKAAAPDGKTIYDARCKTCHGINGKGGLNMAKILKVDSALLDLTTVENQKRTDAEIAKVIRKGQRKMKAIPKDKLNDDDLKAVVAHIRNLQKAS